MDGLGVYLYSIVFLLGKCYSFFWYEILDDIQKIVSFSMFFLLQIYIKVPYVEGTRCEDV